MFPQSIILVYLLVSVAHSAFDPSTPKILIKTEESSGPLVDEYAPIAKRLKILDAGPSQSSETHPIPTYGEGSTVAHTGEVREPHGIPSNIVSSESSEVHPRPVPREVSQLVHAIANQKPEGMLSLSEILTARLPHWKSLDDVFLSHVLKAWEKIPKKFVLIHKDSSELERYTLGVARELEIIKANVQGDSLANCLDAIRIFGKSKEKISTITKLKILELVESDSKIKVMQSILAENQNDSQTNNLLQCLSHENYREDWKRVCQQYGHSILEDTQQMPDKYKTPGFSSHSPDEAFDEQSEDVPIMGMYHFKVADFLYQNKFINEESLRSYYQLQKKGTLHLIWSYAGWFFFIGPDDLVWNVQTGITQHWYWHIHNKSFKALSVKQEYIINLYFLIKSLIDRATKEFKGTWIMAEWKLFEEAFSSQRLLKILNDIEEPKYPRAHGSHKVTFFPNPRNYQDTEDMEILIKLMYKLTATNQDLDTIAFGFSIRLGCELLNFIDHEIFPGIIKEKLNKLGLNAEQFEEKFKLILLRSRILQTSSHAEDYYQYIKQGNRLLGMNRFEVRFVFENYCNTIQEMLLEYLESYSRVEERADQLSVWLLHQSRMRLLYVHHRNWSNRLKNCSKNLLQQV
ncbi:hypothetical protein Pst134EA_021379 [Puccinia striiformis f. sp. tritici]|uniref:hypothetical protein n=1 Tax=Puccinia striiformis f. sp. tritici TaxID=168172 RepID=UPI002008CBC6|nr:hypothetical protein Pst134EA_021379 [Puccinia striiformis f. sp. tritici]KAH9457505.1 hypothetical protein Pst134EA_021379 [Puccinia striiformis f. sp. tritici]